MNTLILTAMSMPSGVGGLLIQFLVIVVVLLIVAGLIYVVETYIMKQALPNMVRLVIGLVLIILIIIWAVGAMGGG